MSLSTGIVVALAVAASAAGWFALAAIALAAVLAWISNRVVGEPADRAGRRLRAVVRLALLVVSCTAFSAYAVPEAGPAWRAVAAAGLALAATGGAALGPAPSQRVWRRVAIVLVAAAGVFVALCVAVPPARPPSGTGGNATPTITGLLVAVAVFVPLFSGLRPRGLLLGAGTALAVAAAASYQIGPVRLGLSVTSLRDTLVAADARMALPALTAVVVLATTTSALWAAGQAREALAGAGERPQTRGAPETSGAGRTPKASEMPGALRLAVVAVVPAGAAVVLSPPAALVLAAAAVVAESGYGALTGAGAGGSGHGQGQAEQDGGRDREHGQ